MSWKRFSWHFCLPSHMPCWSTFIYYNYGWIREASLSESSVLIGQPGGQDEPFSPAWDFPQEEVLFLAMLTKLVGSIWLDICLAWYWPSLVNNAYLHLAFILLLRETVAALLFATRVADGFCVVLWVGATSTVEPTTSLCLPVSVPLSTGFTRGRLEVRKQYIPLP